MATRKKAAAKGATRIRTKAAPAEPAQTCFFPTALGTMAIAWRGEDVVGTFLPEANEADLLALVRKRLRQPRLEATAEMPAFVGHLAAQIRAHLRGEAQAFDLGHLEKRAFGPFTRKVYAQLRAVPCGSVLTYAELAKRAGNAKAVRAVGQAMARNPFPLVVPCHRVIGTGKTAGGFSAHGGLDTKARILRLEGAPERT